MTLRGVLGVYCMMFMLQPAQATPSCDTAAERKLEIEWSCRLTGHRAIVIELA